MIAISLAWCLLPGAGNSFRMDHWSPPVLYGGRPYLYRDTLYVPDRADEKIKVYDISHGFQTPKTLWETPGPGLGPGEIPKGSRINNIRVDPLNGDVWVSHRLGFTIYDKKGNYLKYIKRSSNRSWLVVHGSRIFMTSPNPLRNRNLLVSVQLGHKEPVWRVSYPEGIPLNEEGNYIDEKMELYHFDKTFLTYSPTIGELIAVNDSGEIEFITHLQQRLSNQIHIAARAEQFKRGIAFTLTSLPNPYSGICVTDGRILLLKMHECRGIILENDIQIEIPSDEKQALKTIVEIDLKTGEILGDYFHEIGLHWVYLIGVHHQKLTFFNADTGDRIYQISRKDLKRYKKLLF